MTAREAIAAGRKAARELIWTTGESDPGRLCQLLGIKIERCPQPPPALAQLGLRSQYLPRPATIVIYDSALSCQARAEKNATVASPTTEQLHLAHELFHHLEATGQLRPAFPSPRLVLLGRRSHSLSEIAAHAFARELLQGRLSPPAARSRP